MIVGGLLLLALPLGGKQLDVSDSVIDVIIKEVKKDAKEIMKDLASLDFF
jgi:hypothetical protein